MGVERKEASEEVSEKRSWTEGLDVGTWTAGLRHQERLEGKQLEVRACAQREVTKTGVSILQFCLWTLGAQTRCPLWCSEHPTPSLYGLCFLCSALQPFF
jgi:hypothetical protein